MTVEHFCLACKMSFVLLERSEVLNICTLCHESLNIEYHVCECCENAVLGYSYQSWCYWCLNPICEQCVDSGKHDDKYSCYEDPFDE